MELDAVLIVGLYGVSEWIVVVRIDDTLENLGPERRADRKRGKGRLGLRIEDTKKISPRRAGRFIL
jgi:hypothetical protein